MREFTGTWMRHSGDFWGGFAAMLVALPASVAFGVTVYSAVSPHHAAFGALAGSLKNVKGLILQAFGNQVTLIGVAPDAKSKKAVLSAAGTAYPDAEVTSSGLLVGDPSKAPS